MLRKVYPGWWVLLGLFLLYAASNGILIFTLPLIYPELIKDFGWNEAQVTLPATVFFVTAAALHPIGGMLLDRYSPKLLMVIGYGAIACGLGLYPFITSLNELMLIHVLFGLGLGLAGLVANMLVLTRWFVRRRGLAVGILLMGASFGGAIFPLLVRQVLIDDGWREAVSLLALIGGALMMLPLIFLVRDRPETPLRDAIQATNSDSRSPAEPTASMQKTGPTLSKALRSPVFYLLVAATATLWFCIVGVLQHQAIYLGQDLGISKDTIPLVFSIFFWAGIVGKFGFGYLSDRLNKVHVMLVCIGNFILGLWLLRNLDGNSVPLTFAYAVIYGLGTGGAFSMIQLVIAEHFAGQAYGKILGIFTFVDTMAGAGGTQAIGMLRVANQSYLPAIDLMILGCIFSGFCMFALRRFRESSAIST